MENIVFWLRTNCILQAPRIPRYEYCNLRCDFTTDSHHHLVNHHHLVKRRNQYGRVGDNADKPPDRANRAVVAPDRSSPPKEVSWDVFRASVGNMS